MILALPLGLHPKTGLVVQGPAGGLNAVGVPVSAAEDLHPVSPVEGSWWPKTWTKACGPEMTRAGLQIRVQIEPPLGWVWWIWW